MNTPFVCIDVETGGLTAGYHPLLSIGAVDSTGRAFYVRIRAKKSLCDGKALAINGLTPWRGVSLRHGMKLFAKWLSQAPHGWYWLGANPSFDKRFIDVAIRESGVDMFVDYHLMDVQSMAFMLDSASVIALPLHKERPLVRLSSLCETFGIGRISDTHDALEDARLTVLVYKHMLDTLQKGG
jgi:DNA polymerase III epsilon subunit-like protein